MKIINFAIVGCGNIGSRHAIHASNYGNLIAVCDIITSKANTLAENYNALPYYSLSDFLDSDLNIDLVAICTPNGLHEEQTIRCLKAGFHVLCEKPMAISVAQCHNMLQASRQTTKKIFVVKQNRFNPPVTKVRQLITQGYLGNIYTVHLSCFWNRNKDYYSDSWRGGLDIDGGTLFTQFSHFIDLLLWLIGDIEDVFGYCDNFAHKGTIDFEDTGVLVFRFSTGAIGSMNYSVNSYGNNMEGSLTILGEKGTIKIGGQYLNVLEYHKIQNYSIEELPYGNKANNYGNYTGSMSNHDKIYENIISALNGNSEFITDNNAGLKTVEVIEKIYSIIRAK